MVDGLNIGRVPTELERREMKNIGDITPQEFFTKKLAEKEQIYVKQHKPFDAQCARLDFKDEIERVSKESERTYGYVRQEDALKVDITDLDKYGDEERFDKIDVDEEVENKLMDGLRTQVRVGYTVKYRCKQRGHGISVFMPINVYEERFEKESAKK